MRETGSTTNPSLAKKHLRDKSTEKLNYLVEVNDQNILKAWKLLGMLMELDDALDSELRRRKLRVVK